MKRDILKALTYLVKLTGAVLLAVSMSTGCQKDKVIEPLQKLKMPKDKMIMNPNKPQQ